MPAITSIVEDPLAKRKMEETAGAMAAASQIPMHKALTLSDVPDSSLSPLISSVGKTQGKSVLPKPSAVNGANGDPFMFRRLDEILLDKKNGVPRGQKPIDDLLYDVLQIILENSKDTNNLKKVMLTAESKWQEILRKNLTETIGDQKNWERRTAILERLSQAFGALLVLTGGIIALATGPVSIVAIGAAAIGSLLFVDSVIDDAIKKNVANLLAKDTDESREAWLSRVQLFCTVASIGLSFGLGGKAVAQIAANVTNIALEGIKTGGEWRTRTAQKLSLELSTNLELSGKKIEDVLGDVERMNEAIRRLYETLTLVQRSQNQTSTFIFSKN